MTRNYYAPIRHRNDGSLYFDRNFALRDVLTRVFVSLVVPVTFVAIAIAALAQPYKVDAQRAGEVIYEIETARSIGDTPSIYPVQGKLTSDFGYRRNPFGGAGQFHPGQDIAAPTGTPIIAPADGEIIFSGRKGGYGNFVEIDHGNGIITRYAHMSRIDVTEKQQIKRGEEIGAVGSTGRSTGPHLHYEVKVGTEKVDPMSYLPH